MRRTCKLLRHHAAVVEGVRAVLDASKYQEGLRQLKGLKSLRLHKPSSIFDLYFLSGLPLSSVTLHQACILDLKPLSFIASLRALRLHDLQNYASLDCLTQLDCILFDHTAATSGLKQLRALTRLSLLALAAAVPALPALHDLSCFRRWYRPELLSPMVPASAARPELLSPMLPPLQFLTQLTAVNLYCGNGALAGALQDLRPLTGLVKLGLDSHRGTPQLQSDSVTTLVLSASSVSGVGFPGLLGCDRLEHIMLKLTTCNNNPFHIRADHLPTSARTIWLGRGTRSQLYMNMQAAEWLHARRVRELCWNSDPTTLQSDGS